MRTSLACAPSSYTAEQLAASLSDYERHIWHEHGKGLVDPADPRWSFQTRLELEAHLVQRFGKRKGRAA